MGLQDVYKVLSQGSVSTRPERRISAVEPSLPNRKKLIASDATVGVRLEMQCDSTVFPTWASRAKFNVRVCFLTARMADSATPLVACSPIGIRQM